MKFAVIKSALRNMSANGNKGKLRHNENNSYILLLSSDGNFLNKYQNDEYFMMDRDYLALQLCHLQTKIYGPGKLPNKVRQCLATAATLKNKVFGLGQQLVR